MSQPGQLTDTFGRVMQDLRISVTDRCNFRCLYCLPETEEAANFYRSKFDRVKNPSPQRLIHREWKPKSEILTFEEIERIVRIGAQLGIQKIRITGGEPLLRHGIDSLIRRIKSVPGIQDVAMTTNGFLFPKQARALKEAGLTRVSFSLDSLDPENFKRLTGRDGLREVLESIRVAQEFEFHPVKVNAVIIRGMNDHEIEPLVAFACERKFSMRFIEFMPLDSGKEWQKELVVSGAEILEKLQRVYRLEPVLSDKPAETARRWRVSDSNTEIGIIAPVTEPFCGHCNRIRLTADGQIRTCLFSLHEHDLKQWLRTGESDAAIAEFLRQVVWQKEAGHRIGRPDFVQPERTMSCIGG